MKLSSSRYHFQIIHTDYKLLFPFQAKRCRNISASDRYMVQVGGTNRASHPYCQLSIWASAVFGLAHASESDQIIISQEALSKCVIPCQDNAITWDLANWPDKVTRHNLECMDLYSKRFSLSAWLHWFCLWLHLLAVFSKRFCPTTESYNTYAGSQLSDANFPCYWTTLTNIMVL